MSTENTAQEMTQALVHFGDVLMNKTVIGSPVDIKNYTLVPIFNIAAGLGSGGGSGQENNLLGHGEGAGISMNPVALVLIGPEGVKVETIDSGSSLKIDKLADLAKMVISKWNESSSGSQKQ